MAVRTKEVRFFRAALFDQNDQQITIPHGFWGEVMDASSSTAKDDVAARVLSRLSGNYYGATRKPDGGGTRYLRVGALRERSDWPDTVEFAGVGDGLEALELDGEKQLFESAYVVPFGQSNRVAVMGPIRGMVTVTGIGEWVSMIAGHQGKATRIELLPEVDKGVLDKLNHDALTLSRLTVRFPAGVDVDETALTDVGASAAISEAVAKRPKEASIEITMSTGNRRPEGTGSSLLNAARKLVGMGPDRLEVSMQLPKGADEVKTETHNVLKDQIARTVNFQVDADAALTELSVLAAISSAIEEFNQQIS